MDFLIFIFQKLSSTKGRAINSQNPKKKIRKLMQDNECKKKRKLGPVVVLFDGIEKSEENKLTKVFIIYRIISVIFRILFIAKKWFQKVTFGLPCSRI